MRSCLLAQPIAHHRAILMRKINRDLPKVLVCAGLNVTIMLPINVVKSFEAKMLDSIVGYNVHV